MAKTNRTGKKRIEIRIKRSSAAAERNIATVKARDTRIQVEYSSLCELGIITSDFCPVPDWDT